MWFCLLFCRRSLAFYLPCLQLVPIPYCASSKLAAFFIIVYNKNLKDRHFYYLVDWVILHGFLIFLHLEESEVFQSVSKRSYLWSLIWIIKNKNTLVPNHSTFLFHFSSNIISLFIDTSKKKSIICLSISYVLEKSRSNAKKVDK